MKNKRFSLSIYVTTDPIVNITCFDDNILLTMNPNDNILEVLNNSNNEIISDDTFQEDKKRQSFSFNNLYNITINFDSEDIVKDCGPLFKQLNNDFFVDCNNLSYDKIVSLKDLTTYDFYVKHKYNAHENVLYSEFIQVLDMVNQIKENIEKYDFSPLEKLIFIYDYSRKRISKRCTDDKWISHSRDLTKVFKEEEIVCEGYSNIVASIANFLGIKTDVKIYIPTSIEKRSNGHATNICYINDDIYGIHSVVELDSTWNSKTKQDDLEYVNNYSWFGLSPIKCETIKRKIDFKSSDTNLYEKIKERYNRCLTSNTDNLPDIIKQQMYRTFVNSVSVVFLNVGDKINYNKAINLINSANITKEDIEYVYNNVNKLFNKSISYIPFVKALYRVRRVEHSINPIEYPLTMDAIKSAINSKFHITSSSEFLLIQMLMGENSLDPQKIIYGLKVMKNIDKKVDNKIDYDAKRMELLYNLKQAEHIQETKLRK